MSIPVGLAVPKILPVTASFLPAFALYYVLLNIRVSLSRVATDTMIGTDTSKRTHPEAKPKIHPSGDAGLTVNARCHANFIENVPLALLVASIAEANGGNSNFMVVSLATLLFFRVAHAEFGLRAEKSLGWGRPVGYFGTLGWMLLMSTYSAWLSRSAWGF